MTLSCGNANFLFMVGALWIGANVSIRRHVAVEPGKLFVDSLVALQREADLAVPALQVGGVAQRNVGLVRGLAALGRPSARALDDEEGFAEVGATRGLTEVNLDSGRCFRDRDFGGLLHVAQPKSCYRSG